MKKYLPKNPIILTMGLLLPAGSLILLAAILWNIMNIRKNK